MDTLTFNTVSVSASVLTLLAVCLASGAPLWGYSARTWAALVALAFVSQLAAYYALVYALGHLPATITSVSILSQVPLKAILAALFLGEPLYTAQNRRGRYCVGRGFMWRAGPHELLNDDC